jgi:3-methyladenine DNA glycosylase AlkD
MKRADKSESEFKKSPLAVLRSFANKKDAEFLQRYFKTGKGEYAEGDIFLGIRVPVLRNIARDFRHLPLKETAALLKHKFHEARALALMILVYQHARAGEITQREIHHLYLANTRYINNWDLVDGSAPALVGPYVCPEDFHLLEVLADSPLIWERRIAMLATSYWIRKNQFRPALAIAEKLLADDHDLIHKAIGWMLRDVGDRHPKRQLAFLKRHYAKFPRTALRYAIEHYSPAARKNYLAGNFK